MITLSIRTPAQFRFQDTVLSHGWYQLAPFAYDATTQTLSRLHRLPGNTPVSLAMRGGKDRSILVTVGGRQIITSAQRNQAMRDVHQMFNLDTSLQAFHQVMQRHAPYQWVVEKHLGRLLSSPTVWEDLTKTLMTTNITWANTRTIAERLCAIDPHGLFPTPHQIAALSESELDAATGAGYRTAYLLELAQRIAAGDLDVESWRTLASDELYKAVKSLTGFGDYAAGTVLRLMGHYDKLAIDTVARKAYERVTGEVASSDTDIRTYYAQFEQWQGLVLWMDSIRDQYDDVDEGVVEAV